MIFLTGYYSIAEYSKCVWILLNIQNVQYDIFNMILQYCRVFKMHLNTFEYKKNAIWYFLTGYNSILEYSRDVNTSEYKTNYNTIFWTGYYRMPEYSKCIWILLNIQNVQYDILNRILQYCRVFKMRLNTFEYTKCTIWYF